MQSPSYRIFKDNVKSYVNYGEIIKNTQNRDLQVKFFKL